MAKRTAIPLDIKIQVLTESGYRCAVPTCRSILLIDLHHMVEVAEGGSNDPSNLLPLCPTYHALYHRQKISQTSIYAWKSLIVSLNASLSISALDEILFISNQPIELELSADGISKFSNLIGSGYATWSGSQSEIKEIKPKDNLKSNKGLERIKHLASQASGVVFVPAKYTIKLTDKGNQLVKALKEGDLNPLELN